VRAFLRSRNPVVAIPAAYPIYPKI
jgi:hypothetical protein